MFTFSSWRTALVLHCVSVCVLRYWGKATHQLHTSSSAFSRPSDSAHLSLCSTFLHGPQLQPGLFHTANSVNTTSCRGKHISPPHPPPLSGYFSLCLSLSISPFSWNIFAVYLLFPPAFYLLFPGPSFKLADIFYISFLIASLLVFPLKFSSFIWPCYFFCLFSSLSSFITPTLSFSSSFHFISSFPVLPFLPLISFSSRLSFPLQTVISHVCWQTWTSLSEPSVLLFLWYCGGIQSLNIHWAATVNWITVKMWTTESIIQCVYAEESWHLSSPCSEESRGIVSLWSA